LHVDGLDDDEPRKQWHHQPVHPLQVDAPIRQLGLYGRERSDGFMPPVVAVA
jgi:hypothetical protein